ncbi:hypothetical protein TRV_03148 [Trichophyton verrucosum HKI 0517]|uniref:HNH nuclease domain-containing protein n=1 Tax=Trichophyton verrucosum (strain HKI 0517) TaxID=663202 RepID=D4D7R4_TRIVH|nr:uncharacterized protein TRV_03148 [Trichophyton verrucosum HKI 0517]EFE42107.1 hypothetical protein TRV_03148 [Trichophyton verrucosum HKI 0517]
MSSQQTEKEHIPEAYHAMLSDKQRTALAESRKRMRQASSASSASTSSNFLATKIDALESEVDYIEDCKTAIHDLSRLGRLPPLVALDTIKDLALASMPLNREIRVIKRQKKLVQEDMEAAMPHYKELESAYVDAMVARIASASGNQTKTKFKANSFRQAVEDFYEASKIEETDFMPRKLAFCHVIGWLPSNEVRAAHLVPKSLDEMSVAHLFGAGEVTIDDPRNSLMLEKNIEMAMGMGNVVIVPVKAPSAADEIIQWKLVITDPALLKHVATGGAKWNFLHGKTLTFLGHHRPASRYLYFRYFMTYLMLKNQGRLDWVQEVETGKCMWATPGEYLRRSMLINLARRVSDHYLLEVFYKSTTFDGDDSTTNVDETEDTLAINLANSMLIPSPSSKEGDDAEDEEEEDE